MTISRETTPENKTKQNKKKENEKKKNLVFSLESVILNWFLILILKLFSAKAVSVEKLKFMSFFKDRSTM